MEKIVKRIDWIITPLITISLVLNIFWNRSSVTDIFDVLLLIFLALAIVFVGLVYVEHRQHSGYVASAWLALVIITSIGYGMKYWVKPEDEIHTTLSTPAKSDINVVSGNQVVDVNDKAAIQVFLTSKTFVNENVALRFSPNGIFTITQNGELFFEGHYSIAEKVYDSSVMIDIYGQSQGTRMMLSSDGKIMDKGTLKVFQ